MDIFSTKFLMNRGYAMPVVSNSYTNGIPTDIVLNFDPKEVNTFRNNTNYADFINPTHMTRVESFPLPDKVITSGPCTHVFCSGRKLATVRKSESDRWNAEKGFAMAICKATYDKDTFEDLIKYAGKETVIAFAKYMIGVDGYLDLRRRGWKLYN